MKYVKMLGLLAVAAAALMALAGTAAATTVTSSTGETPTIHAETVPGAKATLHNGAGEIACKSTVTGKVESHGPGVTAKGNISTLSFTECTGGSVHVINAAGHVAKPGSLEIHPIAGKTGNGTLTSSGATVVVTGSFNVECGYETNGTDIGEVIGGTHAVLKVAAVLTRHSGSFFCGSTANWTGEYKVTHPTDLTIH